MDRGLLLDDAALLLHAARLRVPLHHVEALDDDAVLLGEDAQDLAGLAALRAGDDHDRVVLAQAAGRAMLRAPRARAR